MSNRTLASLIPSVGAEPAKKAQTARLRLTLKIGELTTAFTAKPIRNLSITYHDVVENQRHSDSGFPGPWAGIYKLEPEEFARHLEAIRSDIGKRSVSVIGSGKSEAVYLTFDDGGASAHNLVASMLERYGWRGHFFITTDWIDRPGFVTAEQIRDLDRRGHVIGTHSCSHPTRMAELPWIEMLREWTESKNRLAQIVGHPVTVASLPGGYYSPRVAKAAAQAGIEALFTSKPATSAEFVDGCRVLGRYFVKRGMAPAYSGGFAGGKLVPRLKQACMWKIKGAAKQLGGRVYLQVAAAILNARHF